jgi:two-component system sensor histidine kinase KdpD
MVRAGGTAVVLGLPLPVRSGSKDGYLAGLAGVALCTLIAAALLTVLQTAAFAMIFPVAIVVVTVRFGLGPAVLTAIAGLVVCDFVFVPPAMAFAVPGLKDGMTLVVMLVVAAAVGVVVERLRQQALRAERRAGIEALRNTLLSALSHDLRTPLATLVSASTALNEDGVGAPLRPQLTKMVASEAARLNRIVGALFDLTRLQGKAVTEDHALQSIDDLIGAALARLEPLLGCTEVRAEVPEEMPLLACDPILIEQVLINLVENAVRHAGPSPIEVTAWAKGGEMLLEVADRGPGVPPGDEERVFQKNYQGCSSAKQDGLGLGLTICRAIVTAHGGRIRLQNREGGGAKVCLALPLRQSSAGGLST